MLKKKIKKILKPYLGNIYRKLILCSYKIGNKKQCYICKQTFNRFTKWQKGSQHITDFFKQLQMVGSDIDNFGCMFCKSSDRERHLFMFFDKLDLWKKLSDTRILHIAAEINISSKIKSLNPKEYIMCDLNPPNDLFKLIDATNIQYPDIYFDYVICNHVLEHIPDYTKALCEIYRILKNNGTAIIQTPFSKLLKRSFEDEHINTDALRLTFYGQGDHVRIFGQEELFNEIVKAGFFLSIKKNNDYFTLKECKYFGVNPLEDLIMVNKA